MLHDDKVMDWISDTCYKLQSKCITNILKKKNRLKQIEKELDNVMPPSQN